jgi:hypothetical protein
MISMLARAYALGLRRGNIKMAAVIYAGALPV